ncbi:CBS domain-containing protein [Haloplanus sp. C73]|uniref:CBS domain-containing protein n=1 Tax=Haloplanus sp. C73 TaxID=3421641 RepID=UPI003EB89B78
MFDTRVETALTGYGQTVTPTTPAAEAAQKLRDPDVPLLVVEDDGVEGVVTESDFVAMVAETSDPVPVAELMSDPPVAVSPTTSLATVVEKMRTHGVKQVLIVDDDTYWGFVSTRSVDPHLADDTIEVSWNGTPTRIDASADGAVQAAGD